jgi:hypothetical protein
VRELDQRFGFGELIAQHLTDSRGKNAQLAIRIPSNENLERDVGELLPRPVGRPSHKPNVWYKSFLYKVGGWTTARRVVAKVEHRAGELFPRIEFIVTNLETPSRSSVVAQYSRLQPGQFVAEAGAAEGNRNVVVDQLAAMVGKDRRATGKACAVLLADAGGKPSDAAPAWKHAAADGGIAAASRVGAAGRRN